MEKAAWQRFQEGSRFTKHPSRCPPREEGRYTVRRRVSFGATALALLLLAGSAGAQSYYVPVPVMMWWGTHEQGQPLLCGYAPGQGKRHTPEFFAYPPAVPTYNAIAYGPLADYPTFGAPSDEGTPAKTSTGPALHQPHFLLEKVKDVFSIMTKFE